MKTVGQMLKEARVEKRLSLQEVERSIKIRVPLLTAIEADEFHKLPSSLYAKGFIRNYAEFLGLSTERVMAFYRRQTKEVTKSSILPKSMAASLNPPLFQLTPGKFLGLVVGMLIIIFLAYLGSQYQRLNAPPQLSLTAPVNEAVVHEKRIAVEGKTESDATVLINGISTIVRDDGRFYELVPLDPGSNKITITATSRFGKATTIERVVTLTE